jgi:hypothetical protein
MACQNGQFFTRRSLLKSKPSVDPKRGPVTVYHRPKMTRRRRITSAAQERLGGRHSIAGPMSHPGRRGAAHAKLVKSTTPIFVSIAASEASTISASGLAGGCIRGVGRGSILSSSKLEFCLAAKERPIGPLGDLTVSMATSMRLAEYENEGNNEELIALIVADMQDPVTPILEAALVGEGLHDPSRIIARFSQTVHHGAALIDENLLRVGAMKIQLGHVRPLLNGIGSSEGKASRRVPFLIDSAIAAAPSREELVRPLTAVQ